MQMVREMHGEIHIPIIFQFITRVSWSTNHECALSGLYRGSQSHGRIAVGPQGLAGLTGVED